MRLGQLTRVAVDGTDLVMLVHVKWGEFKRLAKTVASKSEVEAIDDIDGYLATAVADVRGLLGEDGAQVTWVPELLQDLPPGVVIAMFKALMNIGEAGSGDPLPETATAGNSETLPAG